MYGPHGVLPAVMSSIISPVSKSKCVQSTGLTIRTRESGDTMAGPTW